MMNFFRNLRRNDALLLAALIVLSIVIAREMVIHAGYELAGAFNGDSPIYWAVGRGIVNGHSMYTELFDIKPPGMFLLSALSFRLSGTMAFGHFFQAFVIASLPLLMILPWFRMRKEGKARIEHLLLLLAFGGTMAGYTALRGGEFQTESFGVFFVVIYILLASLLRDSVKKWVPALLGVPLFLSVFFKEPFVITCVVSGLLLCRSPRDAMRLVVLPTVIAGVFFFLSLVILGDLQGYTGYLQFMTSARTQRFGSPISRMVLLEMVVYNLWAYSPLLMAGMLLLWLWLVVRATRTDVRSLGDIARLAGLLLALALAAYGMQTMRIIPNVEIHWRPQWNPWWVAAGSLGTLYAWQRITAATHDRFAVGTRMLIVLGAILSAGFLSGLSGEFVGHHFLFAVPVYYAMLLSLLAIASDDDDRLVLRVICGLFALALVLPHSRINYEKRTAEWQSAGTQEEERAAIIDAVLDACGKDRYLIVGEAGTNVFGFTKHSPIGPVFFQHTLVTSYPSFTQAFVQQLLDADVILTRWSGGRPNFPGVDDYLHANFTDTAPSCAAGIAPMPAPLSLLFRNHVSDVELTFYADGQPHLVMDGPAQ